MIFLLGILTVLLVIDALLLILLVLVQLPKKEAGAGLAFGAGATDALFGAGSGNVLTKITKFATIAFFVLVIGLAMAQTKYHKGAAREFLDATKQQAGQAAAAAQVGNLATEQGKPGEAPKGMTLTSTNLVTPPIDAPVVPAGTNN